MPKKKTEEVEETVTVAEETVADEVAVKAADAGEEAIAPVEEVTEVEAAPLEEVAEVVEPATEDAPAEVAEEVAVEPIVEAVGEEKPKETAKAAPKVAKAEKKTGEPVETALKTGGKRAEKVGIVSSDKMTKTVTVRVDRLVKHPVYRKYVKKRKKFMAHDETGAKIGDKVRIVETRPMSARKRWRVVEILHKAAR